jgi:transposase
VRACRGTRPLCSGCSRRGSAYDTLAERCFQFVPLWGIPVVFLLYSMRRVNCRRCGVRVEALPWAEGKRQTTTSFEWFLAIWAKRLSWTEVATVFGTRWETVFRSAEGAVEWGRSHADYSGIEAVGIHEIQSKFGQTYLKLAYQIDVDVRRLIWVGEQRTRATLHGFLDWLGADRIAELRFVCSDMWTPYLSVIRERASHCLHILDRFQIVAHLSKAIDKVRVSEARDLRSRGRGELLTHSRWAILRRPENRTDKDNVKLADIVRANLKTARWVLLREGSLRPLDVSLALLGRTVPRRLVQQGDAVPNRTPPEVCSDAAEPPRVDIVEGFNGKAKLPMKKAFGFRTYRAIQVALYHTLGDLPLPDPIHRFC